MLGKSIDLVTVSGGAPPASPPLAAAAAGRGTVSPFGGCVGQRDDLRLHGRGRRRRGARRSRSSCSLGSAEVERERESRGSTWLAIAWAWRTPPGRASPSPRGEEVADEEVEPRVLHHQVEVAAEHQQVELGEKRTTPRHLAEQPQRLAAELGELAEELVERRPLLDDSAAVADEEVEPLLLLLQRVLRELFRERLCHLGRREEGRFRIVDELELAAVLVRADEQVVGDLVQDDEALRRAHHIVQDAARSLSLRVRYCAARGVSSGAQAARAVWKARVVAVKSRASPSPPPSPPLSSRRCDSWRRPRSSPQASSCRRRGALGVVHAQRHQRPAHRRGGGVPPSASEV